MKFIRYILSIPIYFLAISIVYWAFGHLLTWFIGLSLFGLLFMLFFFGGMIWGVFLALSAILMRFTSMIVPNKMFGFWTVLVLSIINGIYTIHNIWKMDVNSNDIALFGAIIFTILVLELTFALIYGSAEAIKDDY